MRQEGEGQLTPERLLEGLNPQQREAVAYTDGPLLVLAGAGSGKTRVLAHKVAYLVAAERALPQQILAVTFTNKAAKEMNSRISRLLGQDLKGMQVCTFHSYGLHFLYRNAKRLSRLGLSPSFVVFDRADCKNLVKRIVSEQNLDPERFEAGRVLESISHGKVNSDPKTMHPGDLEGQNLMLYEAYQKRLREQDAVDFDDLLLLPLHILSTDEEALESERARVRYCLVDEYQDVNRPQYLLLKRLVGPSGNIAVVGDPDQSIYQWRGADVSMILNFEHDFPKAKVVILSQNYRSTEMILGAANAVIRHNRNRKPKDLWTTRSGGESVRVLFAGDDEEEASFVASEIKKLRQRGYPYRETAVLYRVNALSRTYEKAFLERGIPYRVVRGVSFYERREVKDILAYMRLALNPFDEASLYRIGNVPVRGLGSRGLEALADWLSLHRELEPRSLWEGLAESGAELKGKAAAGAKTLALHMREILERSNNVGAVIDYVLDSVGYADYLRRHDPKDWEERLENVRELLSVAGSSGGLAEMLAEVALFTDMDLPDEGEDRVNLLTLHAAKGLEFPVVFLVGLEEGLCPHERSIEEASDVEEERRLCYVGMTRAKEMLYLSCANSRLLFGMRGHREPSRFLDEIPDEYKILDDRREEEGYVSYRPHRRRWGW